MSKSDLGALADFLRRLEGPSAGQGLSDRQLLARFATNGDQSAFATIVQRHGPLVLNVCRRMLRHEQDAEDAFQAAFLVLARKAGRVAWDDSVACWLHEVAWRTAAELRGRRGRQRQRETAMAAPPEVPSPTQGAWDELSSLLDEELRRLPEKYRAPLILCYLEGRTRDEAAEQLGWSEGSVKGRLERGRDLLRQRLTRRGVTVGGGLGAVLPAGLAQANPTAIQLERAVTLATLPSAPPTPLVLSLAERVLAAMTRGRLLLWCAVLTLLAAAGAAGAALLVPSKKSSPARPAGTQPAPPQRKVIGLELVAGPTAEFGGTVEGLAVTGDGQRLATASFNDGFLLFDAHTGKRLHQWAKKGPHTLVALSPDDRLLAAGTITGQVAVFDLLTKEEKAAWTMDRGNIFSLAFSPDSQTLLIASADGSIALFAPETGKHLRDLKGTQGRSRGLHFVPGGDVLLFGGEDGTVRFWDWQAGKELEKMTAHLTGVLSLALSRDGKMLVTGGLDRTVRLWDLASRREVFARGCGFPNTVALSPDGRLIACGDNKGRVFVWRADDGELLREIQAHPGGTQGVRFSPDGGRLFTCGSDSRLAIWEVHPILADQTTP